MRKKHISTAILILFVLFLLAACSDAADNASQPVVNKTAEGQQKLVKVSISPINPVIAKNTIYQLSATGIYSDNSKVDLTTQVEWQSTKIDVAAIDEKGKITTKVSGTSAISASIQGINSNEVEITVSEQELLSISLNPINPVTAVGMRVAFKAEGLYSNGLIQDLTNSVTWSSDNSVVSSFAVNSIPDTGVSDNHMAGASVIQATLSGITSEPVTIQVFDASLQRIELTTQQNNIGIGTHLAMTATGFYVKNDSNEVFVVPLTKNVRWLSSATDVVNISSNPASKGLFFAQSAGAANISASWRDFTSNNVPIEVHDIALESIQINFNKIDIPLSLTQKFTATGTYRNQVQQDISRDVVWLLRADPLAFVDNAYLRAGLLILILLAIPN